MTVRPFLIWMLTLVLVQSLALRANFLHRFALVMLFIGLAALPYLHFINLETGQVQRAGLDRGIGFGQDQWHG